MTTFDKLIEKLTVDDFINIIQDGVDCKDCPAKRECEYSITGNYQDIAICADEPKRLKEILLSEVQDD